MRKKITTLASGMLVAMCCLMATSCDTKLCYCFETVSGTTHRTEQYTNPDTPCSSLGNANRGCIERNELGSFDPNQIGK